MGCTGIEHIVEIKILYTNYIKKMKGQTPLGTDWRIVSQRSLQIRGWNGLDSSDSGWDPSNTGPFFNMAILRIL
jgi:hypothetical protein